MTKPIFIAEVKTQSPFGFRNPRDKCYLIDLAIEFGDWISVHTDPRWGGGFEDIAYVRSLTDKPILAKGFHLFDDDVNKAMLAGATYVLCVDRVRHLDYCLNEVHDLDTRTPPPRGVYNARNPYTGEFYRTSRLWELYRKTFPWLAVASGIKTPDNLKQYPNHDAFIVGEHLVDFCKAYACSSST